MASQCVKLESSRYWAANASLHCTPIIDQLMNYSIICYGYQVSGTIQEFSSKFQDFKVSKFESFEAPKFQSCNVTKFQNVKFSTLQDSKASKFHNFKKQFVEIKFKKTEVIGTYISTILKL